MLKTRLIPVLLLQNGLLVRSEGFRLHQIIGNPVNEARRFNEWNVDELIYLDITRDDAYDMRRDDHKVKSGSSSLEILSVISKSCFMPLTWGGRLRSVDQMRDCFARGADKISINTAAVQRPNLVSEAARVFGSQAIVISIDVGSGPDGIPRVYIEGGRTCTDLSPVEWAKQAQELGAGEILLQSLERDGSGRGYDLEMIRSVSEATSIPVIACSGIGRYEQYAAGVQAGATAVAAANIWHFKELSDRGGKRALAEAGVPVRL